MKDIHASIVTAICRVQASLEAVKKDQHNKVGHYQFASTDSIYAEITRKMAAAGLVVIGLEDEPPVIERIEKREIDERTGAEIIKTSQWAKVRFRFVLATAEATWEDPSNTRTLMIQVLGPQTFMAAQSYAEKSYLRSLFKIPTGDMDLDAVAQADDMETQAALAGDGAKRKSSAAAKKDGTDKTFNTINGLLQNARSKAEVRAVRESFADPWNTMPARWLDLLDDTYSDLMDRLPEVV